MKPFLSKLLLIFTIVAGMHVLLAFLANGSTDDYYEKFATPKKSSLILGTSRALQGVMPSVIDSILWPSGEHSMFNFAFTLSSSPFGDVYQQAIEAKLNEESTSGTFIVAVDPWSMSVSHGVADSQLVDEKSVLSGIHRFNDRPNFEYLIKKYPNGWGNILLKKIESTLLENFSKSNSNSTGSWTHLHADGWLEVFTTTSPNQVAKKTSGKIQDYLEKSRESSISPYRINSLLRTINFLEKHGDVYLVRLPVDKKMLDLEADYMPDFNTQIQPAIERSNGFLDMNQLEDKFYYTDGNHLQSRSSRNVSKLLAEWILKQQ